MPQFESNPRAIKVTETFSTIKLDTSELLKNAYESIFDIGDFKAGTAFKKIIGSFKTEKPIEAKAFELVFNALITASRSLVQLNLQEVWDKLPAANLVAGLQMDLSKQIKEIEITLTKDFFENPKSLPFLGKFQLFYKQWLYEFIGVPEARSNDLALALPNTFWLALIKEWDDKAVNKNNSSYQDLLNYFSSNPFEKNWALEQRIQAYYRNIQSYYHQPALGDAQIKLSDIYIEPNFGVHRRNLSNYEHYSSEESYVNLCTDSIHEFINNNWLLRQEKLKVKAEKARLLLLLGQPGQGKTSFCFRLIHDTLQDLVFDKDLIFIRLRDLENPRDFIEHPLKELKRHFEESGLRFDFDNGTLILDGLDELYMSEGLTNTDISEFFRKLPLTLNQKPNLQILLTSRWHYVDLSKIDKDDALILSLSPLTLEQQLQWLRTYRNVHTNCQLTEDKLVKVNDEENTTLKPIRELVNQPILLHLVAKADFDIQAGENRAQVYKNLFDTIVQRKWSKEGQLKKFTNLTEEKAFSAFRRYLSAIAFRIYQSDYQFMLISDLQKMRETEKFIENYLSKSKFGTIEDGLKDVLITFYFREIEQTKVQKLTGSVRDQAFEFYHKSLQEYLTAEHIWNVVSEKFTAKIGDEYALDAWEDALKFVWETFSSKPLTQELADYLAEIIENDKNLEQKKQLVTRMVYFLPKLLEHQFLYEYNINLGKGNPIELALSCFYGYWHFLKYVMPENNFITDEIRNGISILILRGIHFRYVYFDFSYQNFSNCFLFGVSLNHTNCTSANFSDAVLTGAYLYRSNFTKANFSNCFLWNVDFRKANLKNASFYKAILSGANFKGTKGLTFGQLSQAYSLKDCVGLSKQLEKRLRQEKPELFERE